MSYKKIIRYISYSISAFLLIELLSGYAIFVRDSTYNGEKFALSSINVSQRIVGKIFKNTEIIGVTKSCASEDTIFEVYNPQLTINGNHSKYNLQFAQSNLDQSILNSIKPNTYTILLLGNSEFMGYSHLDNKIHILLQSKLRKHFNSKNINIINAAKAGALLKDEIYIFGDIKNSFNLNMVIQHTGLNDAREMPKFFTEGNQVLDYPYNKNLTGYVKQKQALDTVIEKIQINAPCKKNIDKRNISTVFNEKFNTDLDNFINELQALNIQHIVGIQGFDEQNSSNSKRTLVHNLKEIKKQIPGFINFNKFNNAFAWYDLAHTNEETAEQIADIYFSEIIEIFSQDINFIIGK